MSDHLEPSPADAGPNAASTIPDRAKRMVDNFAQAGVTVPVAIEVLEAAIALLRDQGKQRLADIKRETALIEKALGGKTKKRAAASPDAEPKKKKASP